MNSMMKTVMIVREGLCLGAQQITQKEEVINGIFRYEENESQI